MAKLARWNPLREMLDIKDDFDRLIDRFFSKDFEIWEGPRAFDVDIYEDANNIILKAEIPGMKKEDISVSLTEDTVTISGKKEEEKKIERENYFKKEIRTGSFSRTFTLPCSVDRDKVKASYKNGVLEIVLPKSEKEKSKEIKIEVE
ncbi:MAG: Hsp20/alpha crystallin family protein [Candidatus Omnitrophica bacterium]|nr:Hsp20/alpha crystallin family protein [Candidatus Omnitrophota bacterium]MCM8809849.1 Hsp20/alpha crystallin family protein [Candidatus Omnitrophota bacterium]MCM8810054.1 Hsp20/alpha crystallin family protein [Candidatus Omnitrophota bacterium]MCM8832879.1 Hsp20/alpha crystallin family protein [Candidatus Omnitrophota bacterium]